MAKKTTAPEPPMQPLTTPPIDPTVDPTAIKTTTEQKKRPSRSQAVKPRSKQEIREIVLEEYREFIVVTVSKGLLQRGENVGLIPEISKKYADMSKLYLTTLSDERLSKSIASLYAEYVGIMVVRGTHPDEIFPTAFWLMEAVAKDL